jgi:hypothetical protein
MAKLPLRGSAGKSDAAGRLNARDAARNLARHAFLARKASASVIDKALVSTGVLTAVISASFATYMVSSDHPHPMFGGVEHLMIFAQPSRDYPGAAIARATSPIGQPGIDYTVTGTIPAKPSASSETPLSGLPEPILSTYVLHEVRDGVAIVAGGDDVYRIERGSILPGVGRVLAIEQRGGKWVVVTSQGLITDGSL